MLTIEAKFYRENVPSVINERIVRNAVLSIGASLVDAQRWPGFVLDGVPYLRRLNLLSGLMDATYGPGISVQRVPHRAGARTLRSLARTS